MGAPRVLKEARLFVKGMVVGRGVRFKVVGFALRASMVGPVFVLLMVGVRGVRFQSVLRVHEGGPTIVFVMGEGRGANMKGVGRAHKVVQIFARLMAEERDALGGSPGRVWARVRGRAISSPEVRRASAHLIVPRFRTSGFMGLIHLGL